MKFKIPAKIGSLTVKGVNPQWNDAKYFVIPDQKSKSLRWWQTEAFEDLKDERFGFVAAFCGSGKSILQIAFAIHDIVSSEHTQKQLIVVPQQHIHKGFVGDESLDFVPIVVDGKEYEWKIMPNHNFCDDKQKQVLANLKDWLLTDAKILGKNYKGQIVSGLNAVASHQAIGMVWNQLTNAEKKQALSHLTFRIDEAHHISGVYNQSDDDLTPANKIICNNNATNLGLICQAIINSDDKSSKLHLATATPYRGDQTIILSNGVKKLFKFYYLDWIKHWETLGIEKFGVEYEEYDGDPISQVIANIASEPKEKHMIVIPSTSQKWRTNGKEELQSLLKEVYKLYPKERVLDLVTPNTQDKNKALLLQEPKAASKESKFDVVVTCMLGREGTDWCPCSRLHNTACENSVTLAIQTMGRPFRRFEKKKSVQITYYVRRFKAPKKGMTVRELLSDRTNALLICMQLDEMNHPILIPKMPEQKGNGTKAEKQVKTSLQEIFGDQYQKVKQQLVEEIEMLETKNAEEIDAVINGIIEQYEIKDDLESIRDALRVLILRQLSGELKNLGIDVAFLREKGFDKIIEDFDINNASIFFGHFNSKDWKIIRGIFKDHWDVRYEEAVKFFGLIDE